jgi:electron transfer flavoprotein alpha subunit
VDLPVKEGAAVDTILYLAHTEADGTLCRTGLEALGAARALASSLQAPLSVALFGADVAAAADSLAGSGAERFFGVSGAEFADPRYGSDAAASEALCRAAGATLIVAPGTSRLARVMAGVAQRLGGRIDTHATALAAEGGAPAAQRWFYRQRIEAKLRRAHRPWVILLDAGCSPAFEAGQGKASLEAVAVTLADGARRTRVEGLKAPRSEKQTIRPDAKLLLVAGAGWTKKQADGKTHPEDAEKLILGFLDLAKASLGSSKSLVDQSGEGQAVLTFMSHLNQVGQTGATPRHPKGLATCCHGEEPHVVGWRFIGERRAVNLDPNCGWSRGKADVLYVADAFAVMAKVNALLAAKG